MIRVSSSKEAVELKFFGVMGYEFTFSHVCGHPVYAMLVEKEMRNMLGAQMQRVRKQAYDEGWKDAKAKRAKADWFSSLL